MDKKIALFLLFFSSSVFADTLSFQFDNARLADVVNYVFRTVLKTDYIISRDVPLDTLVTFKLTDIEPVDVLPSFRRVLNAYDLDVSPAGRVLILGRLASGASAVSAPAGVGVGGAVAGGSPLLSGGVGVDFDIPVRVYFPRYRSVDYLSSVVRVSGGRLADVQQSNQFVNQPNQFSQINQTNQNLNQVNQLNQLNQLNQRQQVVNSVAQVERDFLLFSASDDVYKKILLLLDQIDVAPTVVQIKAVVLELTTGDDSQRSINVIASLLSSKFGIVFDAGSTAKNQLSVKLPDLSVLLSAVDGDSRFRYLSEPYMRVVDGESAKLTVGQEVPTRGAVVQNSTGQNIQSIEYRTAGLMLEVFPRIYADSVQLKINQEISSFTTTNTSGIDSPTILKRQASSVVRLGDGELFILGGLDEERDTSSRSGVSFLPDFLSARSSTKSKSQILIIMELRRLKPDSALLNL